MKKIYVLLILIFFLTSIFAEEQTLIGNDIESIGGFGGVGTRMVFIGGKTGLMVGGQGGILINNQFLIGASGYGLVSDIDVKERYKNDFDVISFEYGGLDLEYIIKPDNAIHSVVGLMIGSGRFSLDKNTYNYEFVDDFIWMLEPKAKIEFNMIKYFKIDVALNYRFVFDSETEDYTNSDLSGLSLELLFKFGGNIFNTTNKNDLIRSF